MNILKKQLIKTKCKTLKELINSTVHIILIKRGSKNNSPILQKIGPINTYYILLYKQKEIKNIIFPII